MVTRDGRKTICNYYFNTKLVVNELCNGKYAVEENPFERYYWFHILMAMKKITIDVILTRIILGRLVE